VSAFASAPCRFAAGLLSTLLLLSAALPAAAPPALPLPPPRTTGGKPLMDALRERQSQREFRADALEPQVLSDLLWAAFGVNRPANTHRTAPSAMNSQEIDLYVLLRAGAYRYDAVQHRLDPVAEGDLRAQTGGQDFVKVAPLALVFVADLARMVKAKPEVKEPYAWVDTGYVSQNVYLYCASAGLGTVVHELGSRPPLSTALQLRPDQRITLAQTVGYPAPRRPAPAGK
jgi:SagB-type dehydrogenase family enzyme